MADQNKLSYRSKLAKKLNTRRKFLGKVGEGLAENFLNKEKKTDIYQDAKQEKIEKREKQKIIKYIESWNSFSEAKKNYEELPEGTDIKKLGWEKVKELEGEGFNNKCMMEYKKLDEIIDNATIDDIKESLRSIWAAIAETRKLRKNRTTEGITEKHLDLRVDKFSIMYSQRLLQLAEAFHTGIEISGIIHLFDQCKNKRNFDDGECLNNFLEAKRIITEKSVAKCNSLGDLEKFEGIFGNHMNTEIYHKKWKEIKDTQDEAVAYESCTSLSQALRGYTQFAYNEEWKKKRYEKIVSLFNIGDLTTEIYKIYDGSDKDVDKRMDFKKAWDEVGETLASDYVYGPLPNEDALPKLRDFIGKHPEYPELKKIYKDAIESERKKLLKILGISA